MVDQGWSMSWLLLPDGDCHSHYLGHSQTDRVCHIGQRNTDSGCSQMSGCSDHIHDGRDSHVNLVCHDNRDCHGSHATSCHSPEDSAGWSSLSGPCNPHYSSPLHR